MASSGRPSSRPICGLAMPGVSLQHLEHVLRDAPRRRPDLSPRISTARRLSWLPPPRARVSCWLPPDARVVIVVPGMPTSTRRRSVAIWSLVRVRSSRGTSLTVTLTLDADPPMKPPPPAELMIVVASGTLARTMSSSRMRDLPRCARRACRPACARRPRLRLRRSAARARSGSSAGSANAATVSAAAAAESPSAGDAARCGSSDGRTSSMPSKHALARR